ncbi:hypothetical protein PIB30_076853, partial [Stylosanthes scabra]|nr:hypothetical protein [Stylosanthes scabra]
MHKHHCTRWEVAETNWCVRTTHASARTEGPIKGPLHHTFHSLFYSFHFLPLSQLSNAPTTPDPIVISSDSEEDREKDPKGRNSEEEDPEMDPEGENQEVDSIDESKEVPEYIPGEGQEENQNLGEEDPEEEGPEADHEMDPNQGPEEPEEDPEEDQEEDPEMEEEIKEPEVMELDEDEYNEYFADYFVLAPPPSPDNSVGLPPPVDEPSLCLAHKPNKPYPLQLSLAPNFEPCISLWGLPPFDDWLDNTLPIEPIHVSGVYVNGALHEST